MLEYNMIHSKSQMSYIHEKWPYQHDGYDGTGLTLKHVLYKNQLCAYHGFLFVIYVIGQNYLFPGVSVTLYS